MTTTTTATIRFDGPESSDPEKLLVQAAITTLNQRWNADLRRFLPEEGGVFSEKAEEVIHLSIATWALLNLAVYLGMPSDEGLTDCDYIRQAAAYLIAEIDEHPENE